MLLKKPGQFAVGSATQSGAGLLDLNFLNSDATLSNTITHSRAGNATMVASDGLIKWAPHNLALNSASPATQSITVVSGADYTVECIGSGSITLSGAGTGTVTEGNEVEVTASTTTLTLTVSGSLDAMWCYRSDLGGMVDVPAGERVIPSASTYVPTTSSARYLPRVGHHVYNGSAWVNEGVLAESEARTNLVTYSSEFDNGAWTKNDSTVSGNVIIAPDGTLTGDKVVENTATTWHGLSPASASLTSGVTYTGSYFVKAAERMIVQLLFSSVTHGITKFANFNISNGTLGTVSGGTAAIASVGNGWYRISFSSAATTTGSGACLIAMVPSTTSGRVQSYTGDGTSGIYVWGAQLEAAPTPSSYIPTAGSTVTRAAETFLIPAANLPWSGTAVSIQMNGRLTWSDSGSDNPVPLRWVLSSSDNIEWYYSGPQDQIIVFKQEQNNVQDTVLGPDPTYTPGILVPFNIASRHGMTFINGAVDGVALTANTTPTNLPDLSTTDLDLAYAYMGTVERFRVWGLDLGDGGIEDATTGEPASYLIWDQANDDYVQRIFQ